MCKRCHIEKKKKKTCPFKRKTAAKKRKGVRRTRHLIGGEL